MKFQKFLSSSLAVLFFALPSFAGAISGGGGKAIVCRDANGKILSAEMLDIYEGKVEEGFSIPELPTAYTSQYITALSAIAHGRQGVEYVGVGNYVSTIMTLLPNGTGLVPIDDSFEVILPKGCKAEQAANFLDDQMKLLVDGEIWASFSETSKAALITHESLYWVSRMMGAQNSIHARQAVAAAFSGRTFVEYQAGLPAKAIECISFSSTNSSIDVNAHFWLFNDPSGDLVMQIDWFSAKPSFEQVCSKTTANFGQIPLNDIKNHLDVWQWSHTDSILPAQTVSIAFSDNSGAPNSVSGKIGIGGLPNFPTTEFSCTTPMKNN